MSAGKDGHVRSAKVVIGSQISDIHSGQKRDLSILKSPVQNIVPLKDTKKVPKGGPLIDLRFKVIINICFNLPWQSSLLMRF